jgi:SAM-dependent methyltransferase
MRRRINFSFIARYVASPDLVIFELLRLSIDITDRDFDAIYPENIRRIASRHWSPVAVSKSASEFLVRRPGTRVLDIGSGAGKFCMVGAATTRGHFTGVEQRPGLVKLATNLCSRYDLPNAKFIHANMTSIDFRNYDAFYFFNSFYENINVHHRIDDSVALDVQTYEAHSMNMVQQLSRLPLGVRLATYSSPQSAIPGSFQLVDSLFYGSLDLWEKVFE